MEEEDTVEKQVEGLAERVIAEDEARRAEELVSRRTSLELELQGRAQSRVGRLKSCCPALFLTLTRVVFDWGRTLTRLALLAGPHQHSTEEAQLGPQARSRPQAHQAQGQDGHGHLPAHPCVSSPSWLPSFRN